MNQRDTETPACGSGPGMRVLPKTITVTRRGFLHGGAVALGFAAAAPAALAVSGAQGLAQTFPVLGAATATTLLRMARDIFPHDRLPERHYADALRPLERAAAKDTAQAAMLRAGVRDLDRAATARFGKPYAAIEAEADRVGLLGAIETTPFFQKIRGDMVTSLYDNKAVWPLLGYEGSSWEQGGYLNRGFDDLDWL